MKVTIKRSGWVAFDKSEECFKFWPAEPTDISWLVPVCAFSRDVEVDIPDDFNPIAAQVAQLDAKIEKERISSHTKICQLQSEKAKLLCIENEAVA